MQDMLGVKVLHILSADDIYFAVPVLIQRPKLYKLLLLVFGKIRKVLEYNINCLRHKW